MRGSSTPKQGKSPSDNRKSTGSSIKAAELASLGAGYRRWLARQPLSVNTRRTYLGQVRQYCAYLETSANEYGNPLSDPHARDYAIRDFKSHLKKERSFRRKAPKGARRARGLVRAGLVAPEELHAKEEGYKRRTVHALSFHSLRHTMTSILKNAGVNSAIVMDVVGHQSTAISTHYTTIDSDANRRAIERMPDILNLTHD